MAQGTAQQRAEERRLEKQFPTRDRIKAIPLGQGAEIANMRLIRPNRRPGNDGAYSMHNIPWVPHWNASIFDRRLEIARDAVFDRSNPEELEAYRRLCMGAARDPHGPLAKELAEYRQFELNNDVLASTFALAAFQNINLSGNELPSIIRPRGRNFQRFTVRTIAQDGGARQDQIRTTRQFESFEMDMISTDKVEYPLFDIQQGDVEGVDTVNRELDYDMEIKLDKLAQDNIDGAKTTSGLRDLLNIHSLIDVNNLPDKNYLDLSSNDTGVLTITKLKTILNHVALFGAVPGDGVGEMLTMSSMIISPQNIRDPWDFVDLVSGFAGGDEVEPAKTVPTPVRESIFRTGMFTSAWGHNFSWLPNGRLSKGKAYVFFNQPLGWFFTKTEMDQVLVWDGPDQREQNYGQTLMTRVLRYVIPDLWKHRILIIDF